MYFHAGGGSVMNSRDLVGIFDLDGASRGRATRDFLAAGEKSGRLINASGDDIPRTFILAADNKITLSPITSETLGRKFIPNKG